MRKLTKEKIYVGKLKKKKDLLMILNEKIETKRWEIILRIVNGKR